MFRWSEASRRALAWPWRASPRVRFGPPPRRERPAGYLPSPRSSRVTVPASWRKGTCVIPTVSPRSSDALSQNGFCTGQILGFCHCYPALGRETRSEASEYRHRWPVKSSVQIAMRSLCCNAHQIDVMLGRHLARHFSGLVGGRRLLPRVARWGPPRFLRGSRRRRRRRVITLVSET